MAIPGILGWLRLLPAKNDEGVVEYRRFTSREMNKNFKVEVWLPRGRTKGKCQDCRVLIANDGQDMRAVHLREALDSLQAHRLIGPVVVVGIHAGTRMQDYGIADKPDYLGRGGLAGKYSRFVTREVLPFIQKEFRTLTGAENTAIMGFSLGGLSAFDMAWRNPQVFGKAGVFSGSFWWRAKGYDNGYTDADRIMHQVVDSTASSVRKQQYWFEVGTMDETSDRNHDGIIDAIGDTRELIEAMEKKGLTEGKDITYVEVEEGHHNPKTWGEALPGFLTWAFGGSSKE